MRSWEKFPSVWRQNGSLEAKERGFNNLGRRGSGNDSLEVCPDLRSQETNKNLALGVQNKRQVFNSKEEGVLNCEESV